MANKKFLVPIGLASLSADPGTATEGDIYYNNVSDGIRLYKNGAWTDLMSSGTLPSGGSTGQILAKSSNTDYAVEWIENYADYTETVKVRVKNDGTRALYKGEPVYVTGSDGTNVLVGRSSNATEGGSSKTIGLLAENLATNGQGFVVKEGKLGTLNTSAAGAVGDPVWLGVDGALIYGLANKPYGPAHLVYLGVVTKKNGSTGEIFVQVQNGFELQELHNVGIGYGNSIGDNEVLAYDTTSGLWINQTPAEIGLAELSGASFTGAISSTGNISAGGVLKSTASATNEGGQIELSLPSSGSTLSGTNVTIDVFQDKLRIFESGGANRGAYIPLTSTGASVGTSLLGGTTGAMNYSQTEGTKQSGVSSAGTTIVSTSITTNGYPILVTVTGDVENNSAGAWTVLQLYRGSTAIGNPVHTEGSAGSENVPYALSVVDSPSAGTYTYALKLNNSAGGTFNFGESDGPVITAIELSGPKGDTGATGASGATDLTGLTDVTISGTPADNEVLAYDTTTSQWINQTPSEAGLAALSGAVFTGNIELDVTRKLIFDGATDEAYKTSLYIVDPTNDRNILLPDASGTLALTGDISTIVGDYIPLTQKGAAQGVAELDIDTLVPVEQIPDLSGIYLTPAAGDLDYQPLDSDLTAIAALTANGILRKTSGTWGMDTATYLTSFTESDPIFVAHPAYGVTSIKIGNWDSAYGWGDHSLASYASSSHNHSLNSLSNVVVTGTPTDGQAIVWDTTTSKWVNETVTQDLSSYAPLASPTFTGNVTIGEAVVKTTSTNLVSSSATVIATIPIPSGKEVVSAECLVLLSSTYDGTYYTSKCLIFGGYPAGDSIADITEYAIMGDMDATLTAARVGSNVELSVQVTDYTNITAKVVSTSIAADNGAT
jgi:hypothetical protein